MERVYGVDANGDYIAYDVDAHGVQQGAATRTSNEFAAVQSLIKGWRNGTLDWRESFDNGTGPGANAGDNGISFLVKLVIVKHAPDLNVTQGRRRDILRLVGSDPRLIRAVVQDTPAERLDVLRAIWGDAAIAHALEPVAEPDVPIDSPSTSVQSVEPTPVGPVSPPPMLQSAPASDRVDDPMVQGTSAAAGESPSVGGDPVLLATGQLLLQVTDLSVRGAGLSFEFVRTYLSGVLYRGPLGFGWDHSYNLWLRTSREVDEDGFERNVVYRGNGQGRADRYQSVQIAMQDDTPWVLLLDEEFCGPPGFFERLRLSGGLFVLETPLGTKIEYGHHLMAERIIDQNGRILGLAYDTQDRLIGITDPLGKTFDFSYDDIGRIIAIHDNEGTRELRYAYSDAGDLVEVDAIFPPDLAAGTDYRYLGPDFPIELAHSLVQVINPLGVTSLEVEYGFDEDTPFARGRVIRQIAADGEFLYEYERVFDEPIDPALDEINIPDRLTRVYHPGGHVIEHLFGPAGLVLRRRESVLDEGGSVVSLESSYVYNSDGLVIRETFADGHAILREYGADRYAMLTASPAIDAPPAERLRFGTVLKEIQTPIPGAAESRRIVMEHEVASPRPLITRCRGPFYTDAFGIEQPGQRIPDVAYSYDSRGNLVAMQLRTLTQADLSSVVPAPQRFDFDSAGRMISTQNGPLHVAYEYFTDSRRSAFVASILADEGDPTSRVVYDVDTLGRVRSAQTSDGATTRYEYTSFDAIKSVETPPLSPGGPPIRNTFNYDVLRQLVLIQHRPVHADGTLFPDGPLTIAYAYDGFGRLCELKWHSTSEVFRQQHLTYTPSGIPDQSIDADGSTTRYRYDARLNLVARTRASGTSLAATESFRFDKAGRLVELITPGGSKTEIEFDAFGREARWRGADRSLRTVERDAAGRITRRTLEGVHPIHNTQMLWMEQELAYNEMGKLIEQRDAVFEPGSGGTVTWRTTRYMYDSSGRCIAIETPLHGLTTFEHDRAGRPRRVCDADGNETLYTYDNMSRRTVVERIAREIPPDPLAPVEIFRDTFLHDTEGNLIGHIDGMGNEVHFLLNSFGSIEQVRDSAGILAESEFNAFGRCVKQWNGPRSLGRSNTFSYDDAGRVVRLTTGRGASIIWSFDALGRVARLDRAGDISSFTYDLDGNVIHEMLPNGVRIRRHFGPDNRLLRETHDASGFIPTLDPAYAPTVCPDLEFAYGPDGALWRASDSSHAVVRSRDSLGRILSEDVDGIRCDFLHDPGGRQTGFSFPGGRHISFSYSAAGRVIAIAQDAEGSRYPGDPSSPSVRDLARLARRDDRLARLNLPAGGSVRSVVDAAGRVCDIEAVSDHGIATTLTRGLWTHRHQLGATLDATTCRVWQRDAGDRLTALHDRTSTFAIPASVLPPASQAAGSAGQAAMDAALSTVISTAAGQVSELFVHDAHDNPVTQVRTDAMGTSSTSTRTYGLDDRMQSVNAMPIISDGAGFQLSLQPFRLEYDTAGRLVAVRDGTSSQRIAYDPLGRVLKLSESGIDTRFTWWGNRLVEWECSDGASGQIVPLAWSGAFMHVAEGGAEYVLAPNLCGHDASLLSADGTVAGTRLLSAFGTLRSASANWPKFSGPFAYLPVVADQVALSPARPYSPSLCRFLSPDPATFADGVGLYRFARADPGAFLDASGLSSTELDASIVATSALKTAAIGLGAIALGSAAVASGILLAPELAVIGIGMLVVSGVNSYIKRSESAVAAGRSDAGMRVAVAAAGDSLGLTGLWEGYTGQDVVTDQQLQCEDRSRRLGEGIGGLATIAGAGRAKAFGSTLGGTSSYARMTAALANPRLQPTGPATPGPIRINSTARGVIGESLVNELNDLPTIPEHQQIHIASQTGRSFRRLDGTVPERTVLGEVFPAEAVQVKNKASLTPDDAGQLFDTLQYVRAQRAQGENIVVGLYLGRHTRMPVRPANVNAKVWWSAINAGVANGEIIVYRMDF